MQKTLRSDRLVNLRDRSSWYSIKNSAAGPVQVHLYDEIGYVGVTAQDFINDLSQAPGPVDLHLNSPGGEVFDGIAIYNYLKQRGNVSVVVDALAASICSVIAMSADPGKLLMSRNSQLMIHDGFGMTVGDAADMRKTADLLDKASDNIASIYAERTGKPAEQWRNAMRAETWYSADEAVAAGLADGVVGQKPPENKWDLSVFGWENAPIMDLTGDEPVGNGWVKRDGKLVFDPDGDGDDDSTPEGDTDHDYWDKNGKQIKAIPPKPTVDLFGNPIFAVQKPHGDVEYADPGYLDADGEQVSKSGKEGVARYPIDAEHVQAAWSYINQEKNASQYTPEQLSAIKSKIKTAMKENGHEVSEDASNINTADLWAEFDLSQFQLVAGEEK